MRSPRRRCQIMLTYLVAATLVSGRLCAGDENLRAQNDSSLDNPSNVWTAPFGVARDARTLVDAKGIPFILRGRTAWYVLSQQVAEYKTFLDDTADKRFNSVEVKVITHDVNGNHPPFAGNGSIPFLKCVDGTDWDGTFTGAAPDYTAPNEAYWSFVDGFLDACEQRGIVALLFPSYVGYDGGKQGWMQEMVANGDERMSRYGAWIAQRYKDRSNIIWMLGGDYSDFNSAERKVERSLIRGLKSVQEQQSVFYSAEWQSNTIGTDHSDFGKEVNFNGVYSWENSIAALSRRAYRHSPTIPAFLLEEPYDEEGPDGNGYNPNATQPVRRFIYWGWLNTIGGYMAGNGYVWRFRAGWKDHLNSPATLDLAHLNSLMLSIDCPRLIPSGLGRMKTLVTAGGGSPDSMDYVAAAATAEGDLLVAYASPQHARSFDIDLTVMKGECRARWWDPTSGQHHPIGRFRNALQTFTPPAKNSRGDTDWVLHVDLSRQ